MRKTISNYILPVLITSIILAISISVYLTFITNWQYALAMVEKFKFNTNFGQIGDMFAISSSLFSGIAVIAVGIGLVLQVFELYESRKSNSRQETDNQFFNLLNLLNTLVSDYDLRATDGNEVTSKGRDVFKEFYKRLKRNLISNEHNNDDIFNSKFYNYAYDAFLSENIDEYPFLKRGAQDKLVFHLRPGKGLELLHYFRTIYIILKFIDECNQSLYTKRSYVRILRSQTSEYQLRMIVLNSISKYATDENGDFVAKILIEKYEFFKTLYDKDFIPGIKEKFKPSAFGKNH